MGHCSDDEALPPENVISSCTVFLTRAYQQNFQLELVPQALLYLGEAYLQTGQNEQAQRVLVRGVKLAPNYAALWGALAEAEDKLNPGQLEPTLDLAVKSHPGNPEFLNAACWARATNGVDLPVALADCSEALRLAPDEPGVLDSRCMVRFKMGDIANAIADCDAAIASMPDSAGTLYLRGIAKLKLGYAGPSKTDIDAAKAIDPHVAEVYARYGIAP